MKTLLGIRTVYDIDPTKTFRIADILEAGAILPHSVKLDEVKLEDLETEEQCTCIYIKGDSLFCQIHGEPEGSDTSMSAQLNDSGFGCSSAWCNSVEEIPF